MSKLKDTLAQIISGADDTLDKIKCKIKDKLNLFDPIEICAYRSYGSDHNIRIHGRILEHKGLGKASEEDNLWDNIINMYTRMESDEVPGVQLRVYFQDEIYETVSDKEGYFQLDFKPQKPLPKEEMWHFAEVEIVNSPIELKHEVRTQAQFQIVPADAEFGIISDMDDTVIQSFATNRVKMFQTVMMNNAHTRVPFDGVSSFYNALKLGPNGAGSNPFFYVSSSPWNLHDFLLDFMEVHDVPIGPLLLRDMGTSRQAIGGSSHRAHKYANIERILNTYPELRFILIGDSGQKDAVIYHEVIKNYPDRILSCYIRDVKLPERAEVVIKISEELSAGKVPMVLIENTLKAAEHALENGFIMHEMMPNIELAKEMDEQMKEEKKPEKVAPETVKEEVEKDIVNKEVQKDSTGNKGETVV